MKLLNELMTELDFFKIPDEEEINSEPNPFDVDDEECVCTCDEDDESFDDESDMFDDEDDDMFHNEPEEIDNEIDPADFINYIKNYFDKEMGTHASPEDSDMDDEFVDEDDEFEDEDSEMHFDDEDSDMDDEFDDEGSDMSDEFDDEECECEEEEEDKDFQGIIRTVKGANLVYKRKSDDGDYTELWIYNVGDDLKHINTIKRAIIAGTDIEPTTLQSDDGSQRMEMFTVGNVQYIELSGLQN